MEKTLAQAIWRRMEIGKTYTTTELFDLLTETEYYNHIPVELQGKNVNKIIANEMWKVVKAGYAKTYTSKEDLANVKGIRFGTAPKSYTTYTFRYWIRLK
nr:MAG TPA: hypothetical protein [Caudoviricetes sp.]